MFDFGFCGELALKINAAFLIAMGFKPIAITEFLA